MRVAAWWATDELPLLACRKCDYGRDIGTLPGNEGVLCRCPDVAHLPRLKPTNEARRLGGACGEEAKYLTINGVEI